MGGDQNRRLTEEEKKMYEELQEKMKCTITPEKINDKIGNKKNKLETLNACEKLFVDKSEYEKHNYSDFFRKPKNKISDYLRNNNIKKELEIND